MQKYHQCTKCDAKLSSRNNLREHLFLEHSNFEPLTLFKCEACPFEAKRKQSLDNHLWKQHEIRRRPGALRKCGQCGYMSQHKSHFYDHLSSHDTLLKKETAFKCNECDYIGLNNWRIRRHMSSHSNQNKERKSNLPWLICNDCGFKTQYKNSLLRHMKRSKDLVKCKKCKFQTNRPNCLKSHLSQIHSSTSSYVAPKKFSCTECNYKTDKTCRINRHILTHKKGPHLHKCSQCSFESRYKDSLTRHHIMVHGTWRCRF